MLGTSESWTLNYAMTALLALSILLLASGQLLEATSSEVSSDSATFVAAVYEHAVIRAVDRKVILPKEEALKIVMTNMDIYEEQIRKAKLRNASIIVFPEYGLTGFSYTRDSFRPFLEDIPDPTTTNFTACVDPTMNTTSPILYRLSCLAKDYNIYIVANMGDIKVCNKKAEKYCPTDGRFQYNTNIAFDNVGKLVARYHKQHPFLNEMKVVDRPIVPEYVTFNTPFGKFGTMICFDVLFHEPAIPLVTEHNVDHIAFPTAWFDVLPLFAAIGFHGSWARGMQVNFLGANTHFPEYINTGSGVYSSTGVKAYFRSMSKNGSLTIASLPKKPSKTNKGIFHTTHVETRQEEEKIKVRPDEDAFYSDLFGDMFLFKELKSSQGSLSVCYNGSDICCSLEYNMTSKRSDEMFALGVFDGLHTLEGQYYLQICTLIKCKGLDRSSCGQRAYNSKTIFNSFTLKGKLDAMYVFPQVVADGVSLLPGEWTHNMPVTHLKTTKRLSKGLLTAAMFGRVYNRDTSNVKTNGVGRLGVTPLIVIFFAILLNFINVFVDKYEY